MKTPFFLFLVAVLISSGDVGAQSNTPPVPKPHVRDVPQPGDASASAEASIPATTDPAKIADFERRFAQGKDLEQQGKLADARTIFDTIIADSPEAKGSLREAGIISVQLNELPQADVYFEKLHALVPDYPAALESLIQINQALKRDVKVEILLKEFRDLYNAGKVPKPYFVRERIHLDQGTEIVMTEFFDYKQLPYTVWMAEVFDADGQIKRRLLLNYDPDATKELRAKDPKLATAEQFLLIEDVLKDGQPVQIDAYFQMFALPEYKKTRNIMLAILGGAYKPVYSQAVNAAAQ